jgi:choline dehydrogenase-like flavoprotein
MQRRADTDPPWESFTSPGSTLAVARTTGRLVVRAGAVVRSVVVDPATGLARGVAFIDRESRRVEEAFGRVVVLAASTIETLRILLATESPRHPDGFCNASGLLGRYLMDKTRIFLAGRVPRLAGQALGPPFGGENSIYIARFRNVDERRRDFVRGYGVYGGVQRAAMTGLCGENEVPFGLSIHGEHLAAAENRVTLDRSQMDELGLPVPHIDCGYSANEMLMAKDAMQFAEELAATAGFEPTVKVAELSHPGWMMHEVGGARMGDDPKTAVLDRYQRAWDCRNLFVVDGSAWPSSGCQNPTLTMMALAARACDHLVELGKRGEL